MDVPVYEAERSTLVRCQGGGERAVRVSPIRGYRPPAAGRRREHGHDVEVGPSRVVAVVLAPDGSSHDGRTLFVPGFGDIDAAWAIAFAGRGLHGLRIREPAAVAESGPPGHVDRPGEPAGVGRAVGTQQVAAAGQGRRLGGWGEFRDLEELIQSQSQGVGHPHQHVELGVAGPAEVVVGLPRDAAAVEDVLDAQAQGVASPLQAGVEVDGEHGSGLQGAVAGEARGGLDDLAAPVGAMPDAVGAAAGDVGTRRAAVHGEESPAPLALRLGEGRARPKPGFLFALD